MLFSSVRVSDKNRISDLSMGMLDFQLVHHNCWGFWLADLKKKIKNCQHLFFFYIDCNTEEARACLFSLQG